jgi:uncharacterized SAM-binding protein YcdF (DUF218 family)
MPSLLAVSCRLLAIFPPMLLVLSKAIPPLLFPIGLTILLCLTAACLAFRKGARAAGAVSLLAAVLLYAASIHPLGQWLTRGLEGQYPPSRELPGAAAIVLLGGGMASFTPPRVYPETNWAGDRLLHAARLWKQGRAPIIIATGGYISFMTDAPGSEAELYAALLTELFDVPADAVRLVPESRTTSEDAALTGRLFTERGMQKEILLVTSASHMPRAAALFRRQGFIVHPAPTDFNAGRGETLKPAHLLPSGMALATTCIALHEYMGLAAYWMMGRL